MIPPKMKNPNIGMTDISEYHWGGPAIPTRESCDLNDPKQMFLWMFTAMPGLNGAALMLPPDFWMLVSEHMYELGARIGADPIKKYRPPTANEPHWATSPGQWIPMDTPDVQEDPAVRAWGMLSPIQKAELRAIAYAWHDDEPLPYLPDSPSRKAWEPLVQPAKQRIWELSKAEHEQDPE